MPPVASMPPRMPSASLLPPPPIQPAPVASTFAPDSEEEDEDEFDGQAVHDFPDGEAPLEMPGGMTFSSDFFSKG